MNLPSYFFADLPPEAELTPTMITEACQALKRNREKYLAGRSTPSLVNLLGELGAEWRLPDFPYRKLALEQGPALTGFSSATLEHGLDAFFQELTADNLEALLVQELGEGSRLDKFAAAGAESGARRQALARGPELLAHVAAGNLPNPAWMSLVLGVLTRSAQFMKCASGASYLPRLFAHSLYEMDKKLGACLEIAEWRGGNLAVEAALFAEADCVTATGSDAALTEIRSRLPADVRFLGYGHQLSFAYITAAAFAGGRLANTVEQAAVDVAAWDQQGCLSPHVIYVETGGNVMPERFAALLAEALERREALMPRGTLSPEVAATIASRRSLYEVRSAHAPEDTKHWCSTGSTAWTVVYESDPRFQPSCLNRFIYVKGVKNLTEALQAADPVQGQVSTVGLAAPVAQAAELAPELARWGVSRVCPLGKMQHPPLAWRHDGRPALGDLITWTDLEV